MAAHSLEFGEDEFLVNRLLKMDRHELSMFLSEELCLHCRGRMSKRSLQNGENKASSKQKQVKQGTLSKWYQHESQSYGLKIDQESDVKNSDGLLNDETDPIVFPVYGVMAKEDYEIFRYTRIRKMPPFVLNEKIEGTLTNILEGLELYNWVFTGQEQNYITDYVNHLQCLGRQSKLREHTYSGPAKWIPGAEHVRMHFGCYYRQDEEGKTLGIMREEVVDPLPYLFRKMIKRMVQWYLLPQDCVPNSCVVNVYDRGDYSPPHIEHHDFLRPFCTISLLAKCEMVFGSNLDFITPTKLKYPSYIPLPSGSVLVFKGNAADIAKHCIPAVPTRRISITFRRMVRHKQPFKFVPDPELEEKPITLPFPSFEPLSRELD